MVDYTPYSTVSLGKDDERATFDIRDDGFILNYKGYLRISRERYPLEMLDSQISSYLADGFTITDMRLKRD